MTTASEANASAAIPAELVEKLRAAGQDHVLKFYEAGVLQEEQVLHLKDQLEALDLEYLRSIFEASTRAHAANEGQEEVLEPLQEFDLLDECSVEQKQAWWDCGLDAIAKSQVCALVLSGGQGTRLGFAGPKGLYNISLPSEMSLFQLFAERLLRLQALAEAKAGSVSAAVIPFYVMTSPMNHAETVEYFQTNKFFGLQEAQVFFFAQGTLPCFTRGGKLMLEDAHTLATASDGNGGIYKALATSGALQQLQDRGVKYLHVFSVDNALCKAADPTFIGYCIDKDADCANKVVWKSRPDESVGVVAKKNGKFCIVEYSEMDKTACELVNPSNGKLAFGAANICNHFYTIDFLVNVVLPNLQLEYHVAHKKIPIANDQGVTYTPATNSGLKLEAFIFDVFPLSQRMAVLSVPREDEFAPVKNPPGAATDSPDTARHLVSEQCKRWLLTAGASFDDTTNGLCEVRPTLSYNGEGLEETAKRASPIRLPIVLGTDA
ncbi:Udp-n-acetylglucosamine pyrophosphorylase, partial [Globisporangium splendens]